MNPVDALKAAGLNPIVIDENFDFSQLNSLLKPRQTSTIKAAIAGLLLASKYDPASGDDYRAAAALLESLWTKILAHDAKLDQDEKAPTGDDYNELFNIVTL
jgi:hypothetical protein